MSRLIDSALKSRVFPNLLMLAIIFAGAFGLINLTIKSFPEIATGAVNVSVAYPGATPQEVSDGVIEPIENRVRSIEGVRKLTSTASQGVGTVTVDLLRGADVATVRNDVETRVAEITVFPDAAEDPVITEVDPEELAIQFILAGDIDPALLKDVAEAARQDLLAEPGISSVEVSGVPVDEIGVEIPQSRLRAYGLGLTDFADRIAAENVDLSGGTLRSDGERLQLRTVGERQTGAALADIRVLRSEYGTSVELGEVAEIEDGLSEEPVVARLDGRPAVYLSVFRMGEEQVLDLTDTARAYVDDRLRPQLPDTVDVVEWRNEADSLRGRINLLTKNGLIGAALIVVLLAVTLDLRIAAWVSFGIVVSFVGAFALMQLFGVTINQLSLFGFILALGIVVDDAIVVGEAVYTEREGGGDARDAASRGARRVARPLIFAVVTTMTAFVPLLVLPGSSGSFIAPVAAVVIFVLTMSLLECFLVLPQHLGHIGTGAPRRLSPRRLVEPVRRRVGGAIDRFANGTMRRVGTFSAAAPVFVILTCLGIFAGSLGLLTSGLVRFVFFPEIEGNYVAATIELPAGTSEARTLEVARRIAGEAGTAAERLSDEIEAEPEDIIRNVAIAVGFSAAGGDPEGSGGAGVPSRATIDVKVEDAETRSFTGERFATLWREAVGEIPGARELSFSASLVGVGAPISLQVSAGNEDNRDAAVQAIRDALSARDGVFAIRDSQSTSAEEVVITLRDEAAALGVPLQRIASEVRAAVFGVVATEILRGDEEVEVRVRLPEEERETLADLRDYRISVDDGFVPLGTVADLRLQPAPTTLTRIDTREVTTIEADVDVSVTTGGAETGYIRSEVLPRIQENYPDVEISLGGEQEEQSRFAPALAQNFSLAMFAIYAILALAFQSYVKPLLILLTIPFGFVGALVGHGLLGLNLTLLSMFGIVGLSGIIVNGSLLLLTESDAREAAGADRATALADAVAARFRPILLTTLTTFLGITPLILETSLQAQFLIPTAVSLGFGVIFGAAFVLILTPAYAALAGRIGDWTREAFGRSREEGSAA